jgi:hypothetical protein
MYLCQLTLDSLNFTSTEIARGDSLSRSYLLAFLLSSFSLLLLGKIFFSCVSVKKLKVKVDPGKDFIGLFRYVINDLNNIISSCFRKGLKETAEQVIENLMNGYDSNILKESVFVLFVLFLLFAFVFLLSTSYYRMQAHISIQLIYYLCYYISCVLVDKLLDLNDGKNLEMGKKIILSLSMSLGFSLIILLYGNTNVQWICNFGSGFDNNIQILGYRPMTNEDFVEFYRYDGKDIIKCVDENVVGKGVVLKVTQVNGVCDLTVYQDGKQLPKDGSFDGITDLNAGFGILSSSVKRGNVKIADIKQYKSDRSDGGFLSLHEIARWFKDSKSKVVDQKV